MDEVLLKGEPPVRVSLLVAMSKNGVIGRDGDLPWRLSSDLRRFKRLTMGHTLIMGRKTFESIGRLLPGRRTIVVTRQIDYDARGGSTAASLEAALAMAGDDDEAFIVGGGEIYRLALPRAERLYLTAVEANVEGDIHFPPLDLTAWRLVEKSRFAADEKNEFPHTFSIYDRPETTP